METAPGSTISDPPPFRASTDAEPDGAGRAVFPLKARLAYPLALLSGLLYFLAFPGIDLWPLAFVALVPLILALKGQAARRGLALGWLAGVTMTLCGFYWLLGMLQTFSGFPLPVCLLFMTLLCAYQAGRVGLMGWLACRAEQRGWPFGVVLAVAFAASEQAFPLLFPWAFAGTVHGLPLFIQSAELGGPILVGLVLVACNLLLAEPIMALFNHERPRLKVMGGLGLCVAVALGYGAVRVVMLESSIAEAPRLRVGLVQANMSLLGKGRDAREGLRRHLALTRSITSAQPHDLVVWSETSVGGAVDERAARRTYRYRVGRRLRVPAIFGAVLRRPVDDARKYALSNSALVTDRRGRVRGRYDKQYLLAFGEYLPFGETFPKLYEWSPNSGRFTPGTSFKPLPVGERQVATFICYEDIVPSFVNRIMNEGDAELLVNLTNDAWFGDTTEPWIHLALSKFRAIEQRRYFVRSTNSGVSAFIDPVGRVISHTQPFEQAALSEELRWLSGGTAYRWWGDAPWWLASLVSLALAFVRRPAAGRRRGRHSAGEEPEPQPAAGAEPQPVSTAERETAPAVQPDATPAVPASGDSEYGAFPEPGSEPDRS